MFHRSLTRVFIVSFMVCGVFATTGTHAADLGIGLRAGTQGLGAEGAVGLTKWFALRGGVYGYDLSEGFDEGGISYDGDLQLGGFGLLADFFPLRGQFRITAGLFSNQTEMEVVSTPTGNIVIGGTIYTPAEVGTLSGTIDFDPTAPYLGIGWGNVAKGKRIGFLFDAGLLLQGSGDVTLGSSTGLVSFVDLEAEIQEIEAGIEDYDFWPVLSFGLAIRF